MDTKIELTSTQIQSLREILEQVNKKEQRQPDPPASEPSEAVFPINLTKEGRKLRITLPFAATSAPYSRSNPHFGLDVSPYPGAFNQPIFSVLAGVVVKVVRQRISYGNYVVIESEAPITIKTKTLDDSSIVISQGEKFYLLYAHCTDIFVEEGKTVSVGQMIATIGSTGYSFGAHLHFEARVGEYEQRKRVDPLPMLAQLVRSTTDTLSWTLVV